MSLFHLTTEFRAKPVQGVVRRTQPPYLRQTGAPSWTFTRESLSLLVAQKKVHLSRARLRGFNPGAVASRQRRGLAITGSASLFGFTQQTNELCSALVWNIEPPLSQNWSQAPSPSTLASLRRAVPKNPCEFLGSPLSISIPYGNRRFMKFQRELKAIPTQKSKTKGSVDLTPQTRRFSTTGQSQLSPAKVRSLEYEYFLAPKSRASILIPYSRRFSPPNTGLRFER